MERFCSWTHRKTKCHGSFYFFWIFHAILPSPVKTSDPKKAWFDNDDDFTCWCSSLILCHASLDDEEIYVSD